MFAGTAFKVVTKYQRIDVVFDRYQDESIKAGPRTKCKQRHRIRRKIKNNESVPLPSDWSRFMALEGNKADLALLLSNHLIERNLTEHPVAMADRGVSGPWGPQFCGALCNGLIQRFPIYFLF